MLQMRASILRGKAEGQGEVWNSRQEVRNMLGLINHIYHIFRTGIGWRLLCHWIPKAAAALSRRVVSVRVRVPCSKPSVLATMTWLAQLSAWPIPGSKRCHVTITCGV